jgi:hypothetical protein
MDTTKVDSVQNWPQPCSVRELRGFLGLAGYYRRFIKDFGAIAAPLTQLLKRNAFQWTEETNSAFESLKQALTAAPVPTCRILNSALNVMRQGQGSELYFIKARGQ